MSDLAFEKFFGFKIIDNDFDNVVITNISPIYRLIIDNSNIENHCSGFYENTWVKINDKKFIVIKITPGNTIIDILKLLKNKAKSISLVGIAGTLNEDFSIGQVVCPNKAVSAKNVKRLLPLSHVNNYQRGLICQTDGMIQSLNFYKRLKKEGIDFVDMESFYLAYFCNRFGIKCKTISIISDNPIMVPFYTLNTQINPNIEQILYYLNCEG